FPADTGSRPISGDFWDSSDIVIRQNDDGIFANQPAVTGQDNFVYVRVNNAGPNSARNVAVNARAVAFLGTQFVYPSDFTAVDAIHLQPTGLLTSFPALPAGATAIAKFKLTAAQIGTIFTDAWHSCLIANVSADNDYGSGDGPDVWENNNLGQLNFSVVSGGTGTAQSLPFPALDQVPASKRFATTFIDLTRITAKFCECEGILTLEPGSQFTCAGNLEDEFSVAGGVIIWQGGVQLVEIQAPVAVIGIPKAAGEIRVMDLSLRMPPGTPAGSYLVVVSQRNTAGQTVGGVTFDVSVA